MTRFFTFVLLTLSTLARNPMRSTLTTIGILVGVAPVVFVMSLADGASSKIVASIESFAANALFINPQSAQSSGARSKATGRMTDADARAIAKEAVSVSGAASLLMTTSPVSFKDQQMPTSIIGVTLPYFGIRKYEVERGSLWTESDENLKAMVCLLGKTVADGVFGREDPLGKTIRIGLHPCRIIGVLKPKGTSPFGDDEDDRIVLPIVSFRAHIQHTAAGRADLILASARSESAVGRAQEQITAILRQRHRVTGDAEADFKVNSQSEMIDLQKTVTGVLTSLLLGVAAVSLLVGGIGVMNIMLVSVVERTREIGIRMSIGARKRDVLFQFLIESLVLTTLGGLLGAALGITATIGIGKWIGWEMSPSPGAVLLGVGTSAAVGLFFGIFPARRAANLDPIEALRTE